MRYDNNRYANIFDIVEIDLITIIIKYLKFRHTS